MLNRAYAEKTCRELYKAIKITYPGLEIEDGYEYSYKFGEYGLSVEVMVNRLAEYRLPPDLNIICAIVDCKPFSISCSYFLEFDFILSLKKATAKEVANIDLYNIASEIGFYDFEVNLSKINFSKIIISCIENNKRDYFTNIQMMKIFEFYRKNLPTELVLSVFEKNNIDAFKKNWVSTDSIDRYAIFGNFTSCIANGTLKSISEEVIDDLLRAIDDSDFEITPDQRAILERHASPSPPQNFSP